MCVAKLCLSVCGLTVCGNPARLQYFFTSAHKKILVNGRPDLLTNTRAVLQVFKSSRLKSVGEVPGRRTLT
jgi:hypothetical protein